MLAIGLNMIVIWGYLKFCYLLLDFDKYECYNLPHVTTCPGLPYMLPKTLDHLRALALKFENSSFDKYKQKSNDVTEVLVSRNHIK